MNIPFYMILSVIAQTTEEGKSPILPPAPIKEQVVSLKPKTTSTLPPVTKDVVQDTYIVPKIEIEGIDGTESQFSIGDIIELSIKPIEKLPESLKASIYSWTILPTPKKIINWPDNTRVFFGSGEKEQQYTVILTAAYTFVGADSNIEHRSSTIVQKIRVTADTTASTSVEISKIQSFSNSIKKSLSMVKKENYTEEDKKSDLKKLAISFRKLSEILETQKSLSSETITTTQSQDNMSALGPNADAFTSWFGNLSKEMTATYGQRPFTNEEYSKVYKIIATVLESY
jgi:hypothetical protein